ncbi:MAG TPA: hypothetical protein VM097_12895 [Mycobacteriales bacterium]|nr:hypothetical protein [Mycobacteriales bacterium]
MPSLLPVLWLAVFAFDASLAGRGRDHQLGALALGALFAVLVVGEVRAARREAADD